MPKQPNPFLRTFIPTILILGGVAVAWAVYRQSKPTPTPAPTQPALTAPSAPATSTHETPAQPTPQTPTPTASAQTTPPPAQPAAQPAGQTVTIPLPPADWSLKAVTFATEKGLTPAPLGNIDEASPYLMQVDLAPEGAGLRNVRLAGQFHSVRDTTPVAVQRELVAAGANVCIPVTPMAALLLQVTPPIAPGAEAKPIDVPLYTDASGAGPVWRSVEPGAFEATIVDGAGSPVLRITRRYTLEPGSHTLKLYQRIDNLTPYALGVRLFQVGIAELPPGDISYGGDKRRYRFGYLLPAAKDPSQKQVVSDRFLLERGGVLGSREKSGYYLDKVLWPNEESIDDALSLVWVGSTDRYFSVAVHPLVAADAVGEAKTLSWVNNVTRIVADAGGDNVSVGLRLDSKLFPLGAFGTSTSFAEMPLAMYAGPTDKTIVAADPLSKSMGLKGLAVYNFGGPCGFCTFPVLTHGILGLLHLLHDYLFKDWSLAIIFLVVIVRTILHPVTKWSQVKIARFGKQMQGLAPKQKEINEKYKDDPKRMQAEMARLWREEGVSPTGMLGCVPMFLQMPIWIALSATLYFAVELRHQHAFYGVFQKIQPASSPFWQFLGDLAEPDRLLYAGHTLFTVPILGPISSLNILPLLLGIVFYMQQKYMPQPTTAQTPEQEVQMKMMKWMSVVMFPVFMYNAPAGLSLYFTVNSLFAIFESKWIRAHMDKHSLLDLDKMKAERNAKRSAKPGAGGGSGGGGEGFFTRLQRAVEERQRQAAKDHLRKKR